MCELNPRIRLTLIIIFIYSISNLAWGAETNKEDTFKYIQTILATYSDNKILEIKVEPVANDYCAIELTHTGQYFPYSITFFMSELGEIGLNSLGSVRLACSNSKCFQHKELERTYYDNLYFIGEGISKSSRERLTKAFNHLQNLCKKSDPFS